jgi:hypothetical protein
MSIEKIKKVPVRQRSQYEKIRQKNIEYLKNIPNITCLNPESYINCDSYLDFKCNDCNNTSLIRYETIRYRIFNKKPLCIQCNQVIKSIEVRKKAIQRKIKLVKKMGFKFVKYHEDSLKSSHFIIQCKLKHKFIQNFTKIHMLKFCPQCKPKSIIEETVRQLLIFMFKINFYSIRPDYLINKKTNCRLELDCLSDEQLEFTNGTKGFVNFEVDGGQHNKYNIHFHKNRKRFSDMKKRDKIKENLCNKQKIKIIRLKINSKNYYNIESLMGKIIHEIQKNNIIMPKFEIKMFKLSQNLTDNKSQILISKLNRLGLVVTKKTKKYIYSNCLKGHSIKFQIKSSNKYIKRCQICGNNKMAEKIVKRKQRTYEKILKEIQNRQGVCNTTFENFLDQDSQHYVLDVYCPKHKRAWALLKCNLDAGKWCRECGHDEARKKQQLRYLESKLSGRKKRIKSVQISDPTTIIAEEILKIAKKYKTVKEFYTKDRNAYNTALRYKIDISFLKRKKR